VLIAIETSTWLKELFCGFGRIGASAESVATEAVKEARAYIASTAAVGEHLADQLLLPLAMAGGGSFTACKLNRHARTNMDVVSTFLPVRFEIREENGCARVEVVSVQ
jgi:RNA 3'-terminal phosphate cyclase (ATP)